MQFISRSPEQTSVFGACLGELLQPGDVLCLTGDLGAGKTLLVQGVAQGLDLDETVTSPTFTVLNVYEGAVPVYHFDLYRLEWEEQLDDIGFDEFTDGAGIAIIEWPDKFPGRMPDEVLEVSITKAGDNVRLFSVTAKGHRYEVLCEELKQSCSWLLIPPH